MIFKDYETGRIISTDSDNDANVWIVFDDPKDGLGVVKYDPAYITELNQIKGVSMQRYLHAFIGEDLEMLAYIEAPKEMTMEEIFEAAEEEIFKKGYILVME